MQLDLRTGDRRKIGVTDAAVIRDFYTIVLPDGTRTDAWEQWLGEVENEIAPALKRAIHMPQFRLTDDDRVRLARWISLQYLRGPDNRRQMADIASFTVYAQVGMGGLAYLRHAMSRGLNRDVSLAEAEHVWADITSTEGPRIVVAGDEHLKLLTRAYDKTTAKVYHRSWGRLRFRRQTLAVSDSPVNLVPGETSHEVGLDGARAITVPLDRQTLLWLNRHDRGPAEDRDMEPTAFLARAHNTLAVFSAERFVYFHPGDDPIPPDVEVPRPRPPRIEISGGLDFVNRDRPLSDVLDQITAPTDRRADTLIADYTWPIPGYRPRNP